MYFDTRTVLLKEVLGENICKPQKKMQIHQACKKIQIN